MNQRLRLEHWHFINAFLMLYDFVAVVLAYFLALWLRFDCLFNRIPKQYLQAYYHSIYIYAVFCVVVFWGLRLYKSIWRFASYTELLRMMAATTVTFIAHTIVLTVIVTRMPISYFVFGIFFQFILTLGVRFTYRFVLLLRGRHNEETPYQKRVMLIGAGSSGQMIFRDIRLAKETNEKVCCFIDDNPNKWGRFIDNVPVVGGRESIVDASKQYKIDKIYLAIPSATPQQKRDILSICNETDCELLNLPGMYQIYTGQVSVSKMKKVEVEDLLGRDPIKADMKEIFKELEGKTIMVTGGGGSIGSELCRQIAAHKPKQLIIFDIYENNAYDIQLELRNKYPELDLVTLIGSVRDSRMVFKTFDRYRPDIVYHAAAHKHVPLMEDSPNEAIKNNAIGTYKTAFAAMSHGCQRFVLISTDKAVNPTNIMGASKRLCEMICQAFDSKIKQGKAYEIPQLFTHTRDVITSPEVVEALKETKTEFVAVRFGNVLGSNGSVIPLFKKQIERGGPVTVTHKDIIRYFMTIPEAVGLVLLAGTYAQGGEVDIIRLTRKEPLFMRFSAA